MARMKAGRWKDAAAAIRANKVWIGQVGARAERIAKQIETGPREVIALALRFGRALTPTAWIAIAVLAAFLIFGAYCAHRGAEGVRDRQAAEQAKVERKACTARDTAAGERATDTTIINAREKELSDAVHSLPWCCP